MDMKVQSKSLTVKRKPITFQSEKARVITVPNILSENRIRNIIDRILKLTEEETVSILNQVLGEFSERHRNFRDVLKKNYGKVKGYLPENNSLTPERQLLIGSYFTRECSIEAAALFNPCIILHPDQSGMEDGNIRFIMSFRATGEGHVSSIEFRSGRIDENNDIFFDPMSPYVETPEIHPNPTYHQHQFQAKLDEMGVHNKVAKRISNNLPVEFTFEELEKKIAELDRESCFSKKDMREAVNMVMWLARSNYEVIFSSDHQISERVIFPVSENESRGIEDARFVRFTNDNGSITYYAAYTAYNGITILPQLIETKDFLKFKISTLNGKAVQNKGMALFPKKINGKFAMLSRQDNENNHIMFSDNIHFWQEYKIILEPRYSWEFVQIGNCGSPIETADGWLILTHGVGPMRKYCIGAKLLDLNDPTTVLARLDEPILVPNEHEREGYVPNVVYTCGSLIHQDELVIPYGIADSRAGIVTLSVPELLSRLRDQC